jgi:hypothetical protein
VSTQTALAQFAPAGGLGLSSSVNFCASLGRKTEREYKEPKDMKVLKNVVATCAVVLMTALLLSQSSEFAAAAVTPTTGTFVVNFTVGLKSTLPKNSVLVCAVSALVSEAAPGISQKATGVGTISGSTGTCKITMPYSWALATPTTDKVGVSYSVEIDYGLQVTATNGTTTVAQPITLDRVGENLGTINVPLNGATTTESVSATL